MALSITAGGAIGKSTCGFGVLIKPPKSMSFKYVVSKLPSGDTVGGLVSTTGAGLFKLNISSDDKSSNGF